MLNLKLCFYVHVMMHECFMFGTPINISNQFVQFLMQAVIIYTIQQG